MASDLQSSATQAQMKGKPGMLRYVELTAIAVIVSCTKFYYRGKPVDSSQDLTPWGLLKSIRSDVVSDDPAAVQTPIGRKPFGSIFIEFVNPRPTSNYPLLKPSDELRWRLHAAALWKTLPPRTICTANHRSAPETNRAPNCGLACFYISPCVPSSITRFSRKSRCLRLLPVFFKTLGK